MLTFVAIFLLREWIAQNARPGLFEDDDFIPEEQRNQVPIPPEPQPARLPFAQRIEGFPDAESFAKQQANALHALEQLRIRERATPNDHRVHPVDHNGGHRTDLQRPHHGVEPQEGNNVHFPELGRKARDVRVVAAKRRAIAGRYKAKTPTSPILPTDKPFEFTFEKSLPRDGEDDPSDPNYTSEPTNGPSHIPPSRSLFFPAVKVEPPSEGVPYMVHTQGEFNRTVIPDYDEPGPSTIRRPTLPASTIAMANADHSFTISPSRTPVTSPGLATYHPPEELLETGGQLHASYFDVFEGPTMDEEQQDGLRAESLEEGSSQTSATSVHDQGFTLLTDSETETEDEGIIGEAEHRHDHVQHRDDGQLFFDRGIDLDEGEEDDDDDDEADLFFVDREQAEARQAQLVVGEAQNGNNAQADAPGVNEGAQAAIDNGDGFDMNDDFDGGAEEDMDGALEGVRSLIFGVALADRIIIIAVGIRGPIFGVLQNVGFYVALASKVSTY